MHIHLHTLVFGKGQYGVHNVRITQLHLCDSKVTALTLDPLQRN